jgi:(4-(4-[2-(gamma-L-glutamylamino)ethyl]phenoxymethyl)furan-2-yl)methanamine synthase
MNEFFATTADVYRLLGELDAAHDQAASADNAAKDVPATRQRLARMIGLDALDGSADDWLGFAREWKRCQLQALRGEVERVRRLHGLGDDTPLVSAGCGDFLVHELGANVIAYAGDVARPSARALPQAARWVQVCAPSVAVATLLSLRID